MTNELEINLYVVAVKRTKEYAELPNEVCVSYTSNYSVRFCRHQQPFIMKTAHLLIGWTQIALSVSITPLGIERNLIWYLEIMCDINGGGREGNIVFNRIKLVSCNTWCSTGRNSWQNWSWQVITDPGTVWDYWGSWGLHHNCCSQHCSVWTTRSLLLYHHHSTGSSIVCWFSMRQSGSLYC